MFEGVLKNLFDDTNKQIKRLSKRVEGVNAFEPKMKELSDQQLQEKTDEFKERLDQGEKLDDLLPEAFAVVREASVRVLGMRHFDVQVMGGITLHEGKIAEMKTGEGKTLAATMPAYLNALNGKGVHIVTVNDYLAKRDTEWMGGIYEFLGLSVDAILHEKNAEERRAAYAADITYGTNNEFGFDFLRDNMAVSKDQLVQRELHYGIVDEVDSILVDEARTPLIISGQADKPTELYYKIAKMIPRLKHEEHYSVDEKANAVTLTEEGVAKVEEMLGIENLYDNDQKIVEISHHVNQGLKAHALMKRDRDYMIKDGQVVIVDQFTGRLMEGRRFSEGLHQAIEAKEGVKIERESQTLASITFQNYFRMYDKLAGMTGTAKTEEQEFQEIYGLNVICIPTNEDMIREDYADVIYRTEEGKFKAVVDEIIEKYQKGQPVLVGTISIDKSEILSRMLKKKGVPHQVLNAKYHEKEAEIIANAGEKATVTIATNMAGRGTDIVLGDGVPELGGLHIIGTERHESRRIDNQLRGRSGRQGDPGSSRFYVSLEDDLMRLFGSENISGILEKVGMEDSTRIDHPLVSRSIESAQKKVESRNFEIRKHVLQYDDVLNEQRKVIYGQRRQVLEGEDIKDSIKEMIETVVENTMATFTSHSPYPEEWDINSFLDYSEQLFLPEGKFTEDQILKMEKDEIKEAFMQAAFDYYKQKEEELGPENMRKIERRIVLLIVDLKWKDHLKAMDDLREGIGLRAYGQQNPLVAYKKEAFDMFNDMIADIQENVVRYVFRASITQDGEQQQQQQAKNVVESRELPGQKKSKEPVRSEKIGRNELCPCGSGRKYKKCCGKSA